ncbi:MAG: TetR/AcrR family transcriptional regulator [Bacillota bacterium]|jgi:TetR/AcrR family fatty acid metabolism transcriptional regulator
MAKKTGEKYRNIIEAAITVIAQHGYHNSQVSKIAKEAGVADGTIYLYFQNKEDLLISLFRVKMNEFTTIIRRDLKDKSQSAMEKLARLITMHFSRLEADRNLALVLQIQLRQSDPAIRAGITPPLKEYFNVIENIVKEGMESGEFRTDLNIRVARQMIFGTMDEAATSWVLSQREYQISKHTETVYHLLAQALGKEGRYAPFPANIKLPETKL